MTLKRIVFAVALLGASCTSSTLFPPIGTNLGNPLMLAVDSTAARLYVNNSNNTDIYNNGSIQVYNITTPAAPTLVGTAATDSFSGELYLDTVNKFLYTPNRYTTTISSPTGQLLQVNIDEAATGFLSVVTTAADANPFGIACCDPSLNLVMTSLSGVLDAVTIGAGAPTIAATNLSTTADDGTVYTNPPVSQIAILGTMAYITMPINLMVVDLTKLGGAVNPVTYIITGINSPRSVATDGTNIYVTDVETINNVVTPVLDILNPALLPAPASTTQATNVAESTLQVVQLTMGNGTVNTNPEQIVVGTNYIFVSCQGDDLVTVVNRAAQTVNTNITVGDQPFGMALYSPAGVDTDLYVANIQSNSISIIDIASLAVVGTYTSP